MAVKSFSGSGINNFYVFRNAKAIPFLPPALVEFLVFGAGGGSGSQNRVNADYRTSTVFRCKEGGAGGVVSATYQMASGTQLLFSVGQGGRGGLIGGNPSDAVASYNGGGAGTYTSYDASGAGGGFSGVFLNDIGKTQNGALVVAPGGGGGGGGPGYPHSTIDKANGGGGIFNINGFGNNGTRNQGHFVADAGGGGVTSGGVGGDASVSNGDGAQGAALSGANAVHHRNAWGSGGGGGGGWFGGGSGANDHNSWSGGGGGAGSAFVRGSDISYSQPGTGSFETVSYLSHLFYLQNYGQYGDGTNPSFSGSGMTGSGPLDSMRLPVQTSNPLYPGSSVAQGGLFNTSGFTGLNGGNGAILYRKNGGSWQTVQYTGSDTVIVI